MNLSNAKAITIKGKSVRQIDIGGKTVWRAEDFVPLSYIESDGASYIDTGVSPSNNMIISVQFQIPNADDFQSVERQYVFGTFHRKNNSVRSRLQFIYGGNDIFNGSTKYNAQAGLGEGGAGTAYYFLNPSLSTNEHTLVAGTNSKTFRLDGTVVFTALQNTFNYPMPIFLFACNDALDDVSRPVYYSKGLRISSCRIRMNGELVRNFVPAYLWRTGETGMWDNVNNVFYPNAGSGVFVRGTQRTEQLTLFNMEAAELDMQINLSDSTD